MSDSDKLEVLDFVYDFGEAGEVSIREYLCLMLTALMLEGESFSSKRPFGDSGWESDLPHALDAAGYKPEVPDEERITALIREMCQAK